MSVCRAARISGGTSLTKTAVPPTTIAVGNQWCPSANLTGNSHMAFWSRKNLPGNLRQETSRSEGAAEQVEEPEEPGPCGFDVDQTAGACANSWKIGRAHV